MSEQMKLKEAKSKLALVKTKLATKAAETRLKLLESSFPANLVDPRDLYFAGKIPLYPVGGFTQTRTNKTNEQNSWDLVQTRSFCRYLVDKTPYGAGLVKGFKAYVLGKGFGYKLILDQDEDEVDNKVKLTSPQKKVRRFHKKFLDKVTWITYEWEIVTRALRDGEVFIRVYSSPVGDICPRIRIIEPEYVVNPKSQGPSEIWNFGVQTDPEDSSLVLNYCINYGGDSNDEIVPADEILHLKRNVDKNTPRGISDFDPVSDIFENSSNLLRNTTIGEAVRQAIPYVREYAQASKEDIQRIRNEDSDFSLNVPKPNGDTREIFFKRSEPGTVEDIPEGMKYNPPPGGNAAGGEAVQKLSLQSAAVRWQAPSWLLSSDTGSVNFAASMVGESPWVKSLEQEQIFFGLYFRSIQWKVMEMAESEGTIDEGVLEDFDLEVSYPDVQVRDDLKKSIVDETLHNMKVKTRREIAKGYDLDIDKQRIIAAEDGDWQDPPEQGSSINPPTTNPPDTMQGEYGQATN